MLPFIGQDKSGDDEADAVKVGEAILQLVKDLGLRTNLKEQGVGEDQATVITKTATRAESGKLYDDVLHLVESLY